MAPICLDPNANTFVEVIQRGPVEFKRVQFKVLKAALLPSPYWTKFFQHMKDASGFKPNKTHIEDTGITVAAVEIVLRGLHQDYHRRKSKSHSPDEHSESSDESSDESDAETNETVAAGVTSNGDSGARGFDGASPSHNGVASPPESMDMDAFFLKELFKADIVDVWGVTALVNLMILEVSFGQEPKRELGKQHKREIGKQHSRKIDERLKGKFDVDHRVVRSWFFKCVETSFKIFNTQADFEKLLFPAFAFHHWEGFRLATQWLIQRTCVGNIAEYSPFVHTQGTQWYLHLRLRAYVMGELSALLGFCASMCRQVSAAAVRIARSQLRVRVSDAIWSIVRGQYGWLENSDNCAWWVVAQYNYLKALEEAGVLCPELAHKQTILQLVDSMEAVEYEEPLSACLQCSNVNITTHLEKAIEIGSDHPGIQLFE